VSKFSRPATCAVSAIRFACLVLSFVYCPESVSAQSPSDVDAIRSANQRWIDASEGGDADAYVTLVTEDALWLGERGPYYSGREAIRAFLGEYFSEYEFALPEWNTDELIVSGDAAIHRWSGLATVTHKVSGEQRLLNRKYVDMWHRQPDGQWLVARHMFVNMRE